MKVLLMLLSVLFSFTHAARYGLLRVASPVAGTTKEDFIPNQRSLFDEDFHVAFRRLFGHGDFGLSVPLSFSMPQQLSFSLGYSTPTKYSTTPPTAFPVVKSSTGTHTFPSFSPSYTLPNSVEKLSYTLPNSVEKLDNVVHPAVVTLDGTNGSSAVNVMAVAVVAVIAAVAARKMRRTAAAS